MNRLLHAHGVAARRSRCRPGSPDRRGVPAGVPHPVRALERLPRHAGPVLVRRPAGRDLRGHGPPERRDRGRDLRPDRRLPRRSPEFRPRALYRPVRDRGAGDHRRPVRRPGRTTGPAPTTRPGPAGWCRPSGPTATWSRACADLDRRRRPAGRGVRHRHRRLRRLRSPPWRIAGATSSGHGAVSADHSHVDARTDVLEPSEAGDSTRWPGRARSPTPEATALRRHLLFGDGPDVVRRRPGDDAAPGRPPQPPPARVRAYGADIGADIPVPVEFTDALRPMLNRVRHPPELPAGHLHRRRDRRSPARSRHWPASTRQRVRRCPLVVPRRARGDPPLPRRGHRDRRVRQDLRLHRRHPGVLLDPRPARHVPAARRRLTSPSWWPSTDSTRTRPTR